MSLAGSESNALSLLLSFGSLILSRERRHETASAQLNDNMDLIEPNHQPALWLFFWQECKNVMLSLTGTAIFM